MKPYFVVATILLLLLLPIFFMNFWVVLVCNGIVSLIALGAFFVDEPYDDPEVEQNEDGTWGRRP